MSKNFDSPIEIGLCGSNPECGENVTLPEINVNGQFTNSELRKIDCFVADVAQLILDRKGLLAFIHKQRQEVLFRERQLLVALKENARLKLAFGLVLKLHGCGGENCTEAAYLKDAGEMIELLGVFKATLSLREEEIARLKEERDELLYHTRHGSIDDVAWHSPNTVGHLRRQLETLDPNMAIGCAYFVRTSEKTLAKVTGVSMSYERVNHETCRIESGNEEIPKGIIIWAHTTDLEGQTQIARLKCGE